MQNAGMSNPSMWSIPPSFVVIAFALTPSPRFENPFHNKQRWTPL